MKIKEQAQRPNPGGFGWALFERVRPLAEGETPLAEMQSVADATPDTEWIPIGSLVGPCAGSAPESVAPAPTESASAPVSASAPAPTEDK